ncbi:MAG: peptide-binding protein [Phycisphaeraceae bacterium]
MDNRFNIKDIVLIVLVLCVGGLVLLSMWGQDRRQWDVLQDTLAELKDQRESVDLYKTELAQMKRDQAALRGGVEDLIEVLKEGGAQSEGPRLDEGIELSADSFGDDETFERVADLPGRADYAEGDYFIDAFSSTVKNLTPYISGDIYASRIEGYVLEPLLTVDPNTLEYKPWIAKSWDVSDDGLTITYKMRDDVVFADGEPLDANDVVFTYEWVMNPDVDAPRTRSYFEKFESVTALDDHTVRFVYREPYFQALSVTGLYLNILPEHWVRQFTAEQYNSTPGLLFGSGPYKLAGDPREWQPGRGQIELVRNENYWGPRPALDKVIWREIQEYNAQIAVFRNEKIDRIAIRANNYRDLSADEQMRDVGRLYEYEYVSSGYSYIGWNQKKNGRPTAFANQKVRQAMTLLVDRSSIASGIYDNLVSVASGPFHPLGWQADPEIEPWAYDPGQAERLLDEAGYLKDDNGVRRSPQGEALSFEFIYSTGSTESNDIAQTIKSAMGQAGIEVRTNPMDWPAMQQKLDDRSFDAIMLGWGGSISSDLYQMFHSDQIVDGGNNYISHDNEALDQAIEKARTTVDQDECERLWREVHAMLHEQQPYTFMFNRKSVIYMNKRLRNVEITSIGPNFAWEYYVPGPLQLHSGAN